MTSLSPDETLLIDRAARQPMRRQVEQWAAINTGTGNLSGLSDVAALLSASFSTLPGTLKLIDPEPVDSIAANGRPFARQNGKHLHLAVRPGANRRVLLTGHMDTVFAPDHPFQCVRESEPGILNGPGVADMKGGIAVILAALTALEAGPDAPALGYDVLINSDEETGSLSSAKLITDLAQGKLAALTFEPAALPDGTLAGARPGSANFSFTVTGKSAHAGRNPEDGRNAVLAAAALALKLAALKSPTLSVNPARIDGGGPNNVVPDHAILRVNLRPLMPDDLTRATEGIDRAISDIVAEHGVSIHSHGGFNRPPKPLDAGAAQLFGLVRDCGRDLGQTIGWTSTGGVCDGNNIAACGVPVVDTMGVRGGAIHSADEYLIVASLAERVMLAALTLHRLANGAFQ